MANRAMYALVSGKPTWINSQNETIDFSMVNLGADPTSNNHAVRKSWADSTYSVIGHTHSYIPTSEKGANSGVATLNANGKLTAAQVPAIAITDTFVVASQSAMLALSTAETGDVAVRTDVNKSFILAGTDPATLADWQELLTPADAVASVNGQTGTVVLDSDDISEGSTNLYFTDARVRGAVLTGFNAAAGGAVAATDTVLEALQKLEYRTNLNDAKVTYSATTARSDLIASSISDGDTTHAPDGNSVYDALAGKSDTSHTHAGVYQPVDAGVTVTNDNASAITIRQAVYLKSDGHVDLARANALATCPDVVGFVKDASIDAAATGKATFKAGEIIGGFSSLTIGSFYYVSAATAGAITATPPAATSGNVYKPIGYAISATELVYMPGQSVEVIS